MIFPSKAKAEKRRRFFKKGITVRCGGVDAILVKADKVLAVDLVDMNLKPYATGFDFSLYVEVKRSNGRMGKEWWAGSNTSIPRKK